MFQVFGVSSLGIWLGDGEGKVGRGIDETCMGGKEICGWGLVEVVSPRELPICSAMSCCIKDINKLVINVMIEALSAEESTKGEDV